MPRARVNRSNGAGPAGSDKMGKPVKNRQIGEREVMSKNPAKDFGPIAADYAFFETHATEPENDARAYAEHLAGILPAEGPIRLLDFGCGSGSFSLRFLQQTGWPADRLRLTLVEPVEAARQQAIVRLREKTVHPIIDAATLPDGVAGSFDVVLANHSLYYVPALPGLTTRLLAALAPAGVFVTAIAGRTNALVAFWIAGFGALGREVPHHTSEDVEAALQASGAAYDKQVVPYELTFPDTEENRMHILRFLLGDNLAQMPLQQLLSMFDQHAHAGRIEMRTGCDHFTVRAKP